MTKKLNCRLGLFCVTKVRVLHNKLNHLKDVLIYSIKNSSSRIIEEYYRCFVKSNKAIREVNNLKNGHYLSNITSSLLGKYCII